MANGVFRGFVTGVVISGVGVGALSLLTALPDGPAPKAIPVEVPAGSDFEGKREDKEPVLPGGETAPAPGTSPRIETPPAEGGAPVDEDATQPAGRPETDTPDNTLTPPDDGAPVTADAETDSAPNPATDVQQPSTPEGDDARISTDPAQPAAPDTPEDKAFPEEEPKDDTTVDASPAAEDGEPPAPPKRAEPLPSVTDDTVADNRPRIGTPVGTLTDKDDTEEPAAAPEPESAPEPPIVANAAPFDNPEGKPLMSIVLLDDGTSDIGLDALAAFPYPLSFAVNVLAKDAAERMARYRAAGFEVMATIDMPAGATATDTETLLRGALDQMPQTVAVMEGDDTGLQTSKPVSDQVAAILAQSGHGLVLFPKGLNTAQKLAAKEGVPSATVFRDFDAKNQKAAIIRRFLDQAAFKARQEESGVIMLGRLRADTISALLLWGLQDRATSVALAPISALLLGAQN